ncbi:MAG: hypothetical protein MI919_12135 [Holophagales bacterium]|nr:hypothetical protein [Holophagales bacterium]
MPEQAVVVTEQTSISAQEVVDRYFLENRARLLDLAAFLDRVDRTREAEQGQEDFRYLALLRGIRLLLETDDRRVVSVLKSLSDTTLEPIPAAGEKGARGAFAGAVP